MALGSQIINQEKFRGKQKVRETLCVGEGGAQNPQILSLLESVKSLTFEINFFISNRNERRFCSHKSALLSQHGVEMSCRMIVML